ncbi:MAG: orotate phosphoribosyltransferase [Candidatus Omnitrophica bacterium]|nr:orotate phosphoribosyltransferase [Candidatus Omnitrophota bacterium]
MQTQSINDIRQRLLSILKTRSYKKQRVTLSSGKTSDFYLDARRSSLHAAGAYCIGRLMLDAIKNDRADAIGGLTLGADPIIGATIALSAGQKQPLDGFIVRKEPKKHGMQRLIEGLELTAESRVVIVDDVVTTGSSTVAAINAVKETGATIVRVLCVVDRNEGGRQAIAAACGRKLDALFTLEDFQP